MGRVQRRVTAGCAGRHSRRRGEGVAGVCGRGQHSAEAHVTRDARARVCLIRVRAGGGQLGTQGHGAGGAGVRVSPEVCGTGCATQLGWADGLRGNRARGPCEGDHCEGACCCRAAAPDSLATTSTEAGARATVRHTARRKLWRVVLGAEARSRWSCWVWRSRTRCGARSPLLRIATCDPQAGGGQSSAPEHHASESTASPYKVLNRGKTPDATPRLLCARGGGGHFQRTTAAATSARGRAKRLWCDAAKKVTGRRVLVP